MLKKKPKIPFSHAFFIVKSDNRDKQRYF